MVQWFHRKVRCHMKKKRGKKFKAAVGGIAVVILAAGVFVGVRTLHAQKTPSEGTVKQSTTALAKMDLTDSISASGIIESQKSRSVSVSASVPAKVISIVFP